MANESSLMEKRMVGTSFLKNPTNNIGSVWDENVVAQEDHRGSGKELSNTFWPLSWPSFLERF